MISSSQRLASLLGRLLRVRNFGIVITRSKRRTLSLLSSDVSLLLLSMVVPGGGNVSALGTLHRARRAPIVVLATHNDRLSHILKLRLNTSSCLPGPFGSHRLITHVHTVLHHSR